MCACLYTSGEERNRTRKPSDPHNLGHFFLAIDPGAFRAPGAFEDDLDQVIDVLHAARRADPAQPVLVAGDPEMATRRERLRHGVPTPDELMEPHKIICTGDEVLTGKIVSTNVSYISKMPWIR